jgi:hypothetical protein
LSSHAVHGISSYSSSVSTGTELNHASLSKSLDFHVIATVAKSFLNSANAAVMSFVVAIVCNTHNHQSKYSLPSSQYNHLI